MTEEDRRAAEIEDVYRKSVARLDQAYLETADWPEDTTGDEAARAGEEARLTEDVFLEEQNSFGAQAFLGVNRTGATEIVDVDATVSVDEDDFTTATLTACVDLTAVAYVDADGSDVDLQALIDAIDTDEYRDIVDDTLIRVDGVDYQQRTVQIHDRHVDGGWWVAEYVAVEETGQC